MRVKLGDIAQIHFGPYENGELSGEAKYLLSSHFNAAIEPEFFNRSFVNVHSKNERSILQSNDVILAGKGNRLFAWAYQPEFGLTIPSSLFYVIRTNPADVLGEYLAIWLNSAKMQHKLTLLAAGATTPSLPKKEVKRLSIYLPELDEQKTIVNINRALDVDIALTEALLNRKRSLKRGVINELLMNKMK